MDCTYVHLIFRILLTHSSTLSPKFLNNEYNWTILVQMANTVVSPESIDITNMDSLQWGVVDQVWGSWRIGRFSLNQNGSP